MIKNVFENWKINFFYDTLNSKLIIFHNLNFSVYFWYRYTVIQFSKSYFNK